MILARLQWDFRMVFASKFTDRQIDGLRAIFCTLLHGILSIYFWRHCGAHRHAFDELDAAHAAMRTGPDAYNDLSQGSPTMTYPWYTSKFTFYFHFPEGTS